MTSTAPAHAGELPVVQRDTAAPHAHTAILPTSLLPRAVAGADLTTCAHVQGETNGRPGLASSRITSAPAARQATCRTGHSFGKD
jgi:hypothetical protein